MVTQRISKDNCRLYIDEWMAEKGLNDDSLGAKMGKSRTTIWRWRTEQHRLNPHKIAALAVAIGIEPQQFWKLPPTANRPSVDSLLRDAPDDIVRRAAEVASILMKTGT